MQLEKRKQKSREGSVWGQRARTSFSPPDLFPSPPACFGPSSSQPELPRTGAGAGRRCLCAWATRGPSEVGLGLVPENRRSFLARAPPPTSSLSSRTDPWSPLPSIVQAPEPPLPQSRPSVLLCLSCGPLSWRRASQFSRGPQTPEPRGSASFQGPERPCWRLAYLRWPRRLSGGTALPLGLPAELA